MPDSSIRLATVPLERENRSNPDPGHASRFILKCVCRGECPNPFLARRAMKMLDDLEDGDDRRLLGRALDDRYTPTEQACALMGWAARQESRSRFQDADAALDAAGELTPEDPAVYLHKARIARKEGRVEEARRLYEKVRLQVGDDGLPLARMAKLGVALTAPDDQRGISTVLRECVRDGDQESAGVAHESRAATRAAAGDLSGAMRDLLLAAARYPDPLDRGRMAHRAADLLISAGDVAAARVVLEAVESVGTSRQTDWARSRLHQLALAQGDQLGARRWADAGSPGLVTLVSRGRRNAESRGRAGWIQSAVERLGTVVARPGR